MKRKKVVREPRYQNELSIFEKETSDKIEVFRRARSNWLATTDDSEKTFTSVGEGMKESNIYNGRCRCLTKMRLNTSLLRIHYKDIRPEVFWTFRRKLTEPEIEDYMSTVVRKEPVKDYPRPTKTPSTSTEIWKKENLEECLVEAEKMKGRVAQKRRKKECKEMEVSGPCKKALKRLKAAKGREGVIESCKCEDGREVTVVIKGICLCDKAPLNKDTLSKVCDEYSKLKKPEEMKPITRVEGPSGDTEKPSRQKIELETQQENKDNSDGRTDFLHVVDSVQKYRQKREENKMQYVKDTVDEVVTNSLDPKKKIKFENEENLKGDGKMRPGPTTGSELTLFRKFSSSFLMKSDSDIKSKGPTTPSGILTTKTPAELPKTESMNNLLVNDDEEIKPKSHEKKSHSSTDKTPHEEHSANSKAASIKSSGEVHNKQRKTVRTQPDEQSVNSKAASIKSSGEVHHKHHKHAPKKQQVAKKKETPSKEEDIAGSQKEDKTTEKKPKVRLRNEPDIIPLKTFPSESAAQRHSMKGLHETHPHETHPHEKHPHETHPHETHDLVTYPRSWSANVVEKKESQSNSGSDKQMEELNPDKLSIVTLYKNKSEPKSEMGLTKEEYERMKEAEKERQKNEEYERMKEAEKERQKNEEYERMKEAEKERQKNEEKALKEKMSEK